MELVMVCYECDRKNKFFDVTDWSSQQINNKINEFDKKQFFALLRPKQE